MIFGFGIYLKAQKIVLRKSSSNLRIVADVCRENLMIVKGFQVYFLQEALKIDLQPQSQGEGGVVLLDSRANDLGVGGQKHGRGYHIVVKNFKRMLPAP